MDSSTAFGGLAVAMLAVGGGGALAQLGRSVFDHGGVFPTLIIMLGFFALVLRNALTQAPSRATPYW